MPYLSTNFLRRQNLKRSIGEFGGINTRPELTPKDNIQAHMNAMSMQGGGEVYLGPYEFVIQSKSKDVSDGATKNYWTIPANVSLVGVPNRTVIKKTVLYYEKSTPGVVVNKKSLGPVVYLGGNRSGIYNCTIWIDSFNDHMAGGLAYNGFDIKLTTVAPYYSDLGYQVFDEDGDLAGTVEGLTLLSYSIVYIGSSSDDVVINNCHIGHPGYSPNFQRFVGVAQAGSGDDRASITNNFFNTDCGASPPDPTAHYTASTQYITAGIYLSDDSKGNVIVGNASKYTLVGSGGSVAGAENGAFVSVENAAHALQNTISSNSPPICCTNTTNGWRT